MLHHQSLLLLAAFTVVWQSGCVIWTPPVVKIQAQQDQPQEASVLPATPALMAMVPGDVSQITIGQYAKLWILEPDGARPPAGEPRSIAGRVLEINADEVVLGEGVSFDEPVVKYRQPMLQKVPYFGRLFKTTGVGVMPTPIPGEVRLVKSSVLGACPIPDSEWEPFRQQRHFERIGVDFDFDSHR